MSYHKAPFYALYYTLDSTMSAVKTTFNRIGDSETEYNTTKDTRN